MPGSVDPQRHATFSFGSIAFSDAAVCKGHLPVAPISEPKFGFQLRHIADLMGASPDSLPRMGPTHACWGLS